MDKLGQIEEEEKQERIQDFYPKEYKPEKWAGLDAADLRTFSTADTTELKCIVRIYILQLNSITMIGQINGGDALLQQRQYFADILRRFSREIRLFLQANPKVDRDKTDFLTLATNIARARMVNLLRKYGIFQADEDNLKWIIRVAENEQRWEDALLRYVEEHRAQDDPTFNIQEVKFDLKGKKKEKKEKEEEDYLQVDPILFRKNKLFKENKLSKENELKKPRE